MIHSSTPCASSRAVKATRPRNGVSSLGLELPDVSMSRTRVAEPTAAGAATARCVADWVASDALRGRRWPRQRSRRPRPPVVRRRRRRDHRGGGRRHRERSADDARPSTPARAAHATHLDGREHPATDRPSRSHLRAGRIGRSPLAQGSGATQPQPRPRACRAVDRSHVQSRAAIPGLGHAAGRGPADVDSGSRWTTSIARQRMARARSSRPTDLPDQPRHRPPMAVLRAPLSCTRIIDAAVRYVDDNCLDELSMRRLGNELGVEAMSLYRYFPSKAALARGGRWLAAARPRSCPIRTPAPTGRHRSVPTRGRSGP